MGPTTPAPTTGLQRTWLSAHAGRRKVAANRRPRRFERREECEQLQPKVTGLALSALALAVSCTLSAGVARAEDAVALFENKCAGCHANGGNVLAAGKTLRIDDLEKNQVATIGEIYSLVYGGKNKMPGFGKDCKPAGQCTFAARLEDEDVTAVSDYVLQRANEGWK